jgi:chromosomal replication initiation ATPase DnaA
MLGHEKVPESVILGSDPPASRRKSGQALMLEVCRVLNLVPEEVTSGSQERRLANGRAIVAYLGRRRYRLTGVELSQVLGLSQPAVSLAVQRGRRLLMRHEDLRARLREI